MELEERLADYQATIQDIRDFKANQWRFSHYGLLAQAAIVAVYTGVEVVIFTNLGGDDALLVAPVPQAQLGAYPHLAAFARTAPTDQQHTFWRTVGSAIADRLGDRPLWLSTNGLGVAWLHARLDSRPKYYSFKPYLKNG